LRDADTFRTAPLAAKLESRHSHRAPNRQQGEFSDTPLMRDNYFQRLA
jgi:hypothetical protein